MAGATNPNNTAVPINTGTLCPSSDKYAAHPPMTPVITEAPAICTPGGNAPRASLWR
jgi:hypothetical protein